jgi:hypothetical protein
VVVAGLGEILLKSDSNLLNAHGLRFPSRINRGMDPTIPEDRAILLPSVGMLRSRLNAAVIHESSVDFEDISRDISRDFA